MKIEKNDSANSVVNCLKGVSCGDSHAGLQLETVLHRHYENRETNGSIYYKINFPLGGVCDDIVDRYVHGGSEAALVSGAYYVLHEFTGVM